MTSINIGMIYIRSIVGIAGIVAIMCYLNAVESVTEAIAGIGILVYIDRTLSGDSE